MPAWIEASTGLELGLAVLMQFHRLSCLLYKTSVPLDLLHPGVRLVIAADSWSNHRVLLQAAVKCIPNVFIMEYSYVPQGPACHTYMGRWKQHLAWNIIKMQ